MLKSYPTTPPIKKLSSALYHENGATSTTDLFNHYYGYYCHNDLWTKSYASFTFNNLVFINKVLLYIMTMTTSLNKWFVRTVLISSVIYSFYNLKIFTLNPLHI